LYGMYVPGIVCKSVEVAVLTEY